MHHITVIDFNRFQRDYRGMVVKILRSDLDSASQRGIISAEQAISLWAFFENLRPHQAKFQMLHVVYYFGGILILASMSWFLTTAWNSGGLVMIISGLFGLVYIAVGGSLWAKYNLQIPGGLLITAAIGLVPVFIFGFQKMTGLWPQVDPGTYKNFHIWVKGSWIFMELGTIVAAIVALRFFQFTFITFPLALSLWYMSMDLTALIFGKNDWSWDERKIVSCIFGLLVLICSYFVDRKYKKVDFAFWTYLFGMLAFWGGLTTINSNSELNKFLYFTLNIGLIVMSVYLRRKVFIVFGTLGVMGYISHLAWQVFEDSYAFPIALAFLGICTVYLGVKYQKNKRIVETAIEQMLPQFLIEWRPNERV